MPVAVVGIVPVVETLSPFPPQLALPAEIVFAERDDQRLQGFGGDVELLGGRVDHPSPRFWTSLGDLKVEIFLGRVQLFFVEEVSVNVAAVFPSFPDVLGILGKVLLQSLCCKALLVAVLADDPVGYDGGKAVDKDSRGVMRCLLTFVERHYRRIFEADVVVGSVGLKMVDAINLSLM